jgi:hypothetical protein
VTKRLIKGMFADPEELAGRQSIVEQHAPQLSGHPTLPPQSYAQVPPARCGGSCLQAGIPLEVGRSDRLIPGDYEEELRATA